MRLLGTICEMGSRNVLGSITANRTSISMPKTPNGLCVCIIGVGYVGETLLSEFGKHFPAIGYDISQDRVAILQQKYAGHANIQVTSDPQILSRGSHFLIAVPTLLREDQSVDLNHVLSAIRLILSVAQPDSCIVIESSVPVGTTRKLLGPYQTIFHCGMSPERIDPGRIEPPAEKIPKIISALTLSALKQISAVYGSVYKTLVPVSKPEVAEMTKLHENCYRMVNIAYVNEISDACMSHGIDPHEMIQAASTKPFGFQPFFPGLGVGGHCLPVNPWYLFHNNKKLRVLQLATKLMAQRPRIQARRFHRRTLKHVEKANFISNPRILIVGLGFKDGQSNLAYSPALSMADELMNLGCSRLAFYDPSIGGESVPWMEKLEQRSWMPSYLDNKFDGIAWCNALGSIDASVLDSLQRTLVKSFVW